MAEYTWRDAVIDWLEYLPIRLAYRIIWLMARVGSPLARDVYREMWDVNLSLPPLAARKGDPR